MTKRLGKAVQPNLDNLWDPQKMVVVQKVVFALRFVKNFAEVLVGLGIQAGYCLEVVINTGLTVHKNLLFKTAAIRQFH
jgi:hypothetical protein